MRAIHILSHMALAQVLVLGTLLGLAGAEEYSGGYLWELLCVGCPALLGFQIRSILAFFKE